MEICKTCFNTVMSLFLIGRGGGGGGELASVHLVIRDNRREKIPGVEWQKNMALEGLVGGCGGRGV